MLDSAAVYPTIGVSDLDRARSFYEGTLGLKLVEERSDGIMFEARGGRVFVYASQFAGTNQSTYLAFDVDDVVSTVQELRGRGVTFEDYDLPGLKTVDGIAEIEGERAAWFKDPDGNILAVGEMQ
jgi:catechol 2,3-dioxygenase-like lactoylglutathione lyase family enzyme